MPLPPEEELPVAPRALPELRPELPDDEELPLDDIVRDLDPVSSPEGLPGIVVELGELQFWNDTIITRNPKMILICFNLTISPTELLIEVQKELRLFIYFIGFQRVYFKHCQNNLRRLGMRRLFFIRDTFKERINF